MNIKLVTLSRYKSCKSFVFCWLSEDRTLFSTVQIKLQWNIVTLKWLTEDRQLCLVSHSWWSGSPNSREKYWLNDVFLPEPLGGFCVHAQTHLQLAIEEESWKPGRKASTQRKISRAGSLQYWMWFLQQDRSRTDRPSRHLDRCWLW